MERLPAGRHGSTSSRGPRGHKLTRRTTTRTAILASAAVLTGFLLPTAAGASSMTATQRAGLAGQPSLKTLEARAAKLSNQIDSLSEQYNGLKIQLRQARAEAKAASQTAQRDERALQAGRVAVGQIAAQGYMTGGIDPSLQLLQGTDPQGLLNRASILQQLQQENGNKVSLLAAAEAAAQRARMTATQQVTKAGKLSAAMAKKVAAIQAKENVLNSAAYQKAMEIFQRTKHFPPIKIPGDSLGAQALRWAMTKLGSPYVWGAAGPDAFDCSGLVLWAYAHVGISLEHFTGDQWNEGQHVSRSQLRPGDLVFFFPDISHVGMYVGDGLMIDAPTFGQPVQIQAVFWNSFVGAVHIA